MAYCQTMRVTCLYYKLVRNLTMIPFILQYGRSTTENKKCCSELIYFIGITDYLFTNIAEVFTYYPLSFEL